jgi:hypothetical protein
MLALRGHDLFIPQIENFCGNLTGSSFCRFQMFLPLHGKYVVEETKDKPFKMTVQMKGENIFQVCNARQRN